MRSGSLALALASYLRCRVMLLTDWGFYSMERRFQKSSCFRLLASVSLVCFQRILSSLSQGRLPVGGAAPGHVRHRLVESRRRASSSGAPPSFGVRTLSAARRGARVLVYDLVLAGQAASASAASPSLAAASFSLPGHAAAPSPSAASPSLAGHSAAPSASAASPRAPRPMTVSGGWRSASGVYRVAGLL